MQMSIIKIGNHQPQSVIGGIRRDYERAAEMTDNVKHLHYLHHVHHHAMRVFVARSVLSA